MKKQSGYKKSQFYIDKKLSNYIKDEWKAYNSESATK